MVEESANKKQEKRRYWLMVFFFVILYKITLELVYVYAISPKYQYQGFVLDFSLYKYFISSLLVLMMISPISKLYAIGNTSSVIILLISLGYFVPLSSIYALANLNNKFFLYAFIYWFLMLLFQIYLPKVKSKTPRGNVLVFNLIIFFFAAFSVIMSGIFTGFRINFDFSMIYDLRLEARELNVPTIVQYIQSAATMIMPIGLIYYVVKKKHILVALLIFINLLEFSFAGKKSVLFIMIVSIIVGKFYNARQFKKVITSFTLINFVVFIELLLRSGISDFAKFIQRRVLFMPPLIASYYFDFFSNNELLFLRQSVLRRIGLASPYDNPIQRLIGLYYFGSIENNANTGLVGDAFANFGWLGLIFYPLAIVLVFRFFEFCNKGVDNKVLALIWILTFYKFISGSLFTVLLNGGFLVACMAMFFYPREEKTK
jgi:hypothetical protein